MDPLALAVALVRCPSVTPDPAGTLDLVESWLRPLGFAVERPVFGGPPHGPVANLVATAGDCGPHAMLAGHVDVVPAGDVSAWRIPPFEGRVDQGWLHGRGSADMKGAVAAMVSALAAHRARGRPGRVSLVLTADEEGPALHGTRALVPWLKARGLAPDIVLVGEPTSSAQLGDRVKIGRRGSLNAWIEVPGTGGHVAYPERNQSPVPPLVRLLTALLDHRLDEGSDHFPPSRLEITELGVSDAAVNVVPSSARARLNIRFNDRHRGEDLANWLAAETTRLAPGARLSTSISGEAFLCPPGPGARALFDAIEARTGLSPLASTTGGTSDARFLVALAPVIEFGLVGATMHKANEAVAVADIVALAEIYEDWLARLCAQTVVSPGRAPPAQSGTAE